MPTTQEILDALLDAQLKFAQSGGITRIRDGSQESEIDPTALTRQIAEVRKQLAAENSGNFRIGVPSR